MGIQKNIILKSLFLSFIFIISHNSFAYKLNRLAQYTCNEDSAKCSMNSGMVTWTHRCMHKKSESSLSFIARDIGTRLTSRTYYGTHDGQSADSCSCTYQYECKPNYISNYRKEISLARKLDCYDMQIFEEGVLCAIRPSQTDFRITDGTQGPGFGYHVVGIPSKPKY